MIGSDCVIIMSTKHILFVGLLAVLFVPAMGLSSYLIINTSLVEAPRRLKCPFGFECICRSIRIYHRQAVVENRVDCRGRWLNDLPDLSPIQGHRISKLLLANNNLTMLSPHHFWNLTLLNNNRLSDFPVIDLSHNPIGFLDPNVFDGIETKELALIMDQCSLQEVPNFPPEFAQKLSCLYLRRNLLQHVSRGIFNSYENLKVLDLSENIFLTLQPNSLQELGPTLQVLYLENMYLTTLPIDVLSNLVHIRFFSVAKNQISYIPPYAFDKCLTQDIVLRMSENNIQNVSNEAFRRQSSTNYSIDRLYLDHNRLTDLNFLADTCETVSMSLLAVRGNPLSCNCLMYNLTMYKLKVWGYCYTHSAHSSSMLKSVDLYHPLGRELPECSLPPHHFPINCNCHNGNSGNCIHEDVQSGALVLNIASPNRGTNGLNIVYMFCTLGLSYTKIRDFSSLI